VITDSQVRRLRELMQRDPRIGVNAHKTGMGEKSARKYLRTGELPSEMVRPHTWRTRGDPFDEVWGELRPYLELNPGLEAKTLFDHLQRRYPGRFSDGQVRTLQRKVRRWRAVEGPAKEVFFAQEHHPGRLSQSDWTSMKKVGVTIGGAPFDHLIYHFVLTYSNWETGRICFSESFESLSEGLQHSLWELGGVPQMHQTDRMSAAVQKPEHPDEFTRRYQALLDHYGLEVRKIQTGRGNENGDVEQSHHRFKRAVEQALMLRGSRDFSTREEYEGFLRKLLNQLNAGRRERFEEERTVLRGLPQRRVETCRRYPKIRVSRGSLIQVLNNTYSVDSRLIGEHVEVMLHAEHLDVWYGQRCVERIPRLRGENKHDVQYRHVIEWLVRKPGAFENYRYREDMFPSSRFRRAYDELRRRHGMPKASREYLQILEMAAEEGEELVERAIVAIQDAAEGLEVEGVERRIAKGWEVEKPQEVRVAAVDVSVYDELLSSQELQRAGS